MKVEALAAEVGISARHLRRAFADNVGLSPKHYARVVRLQRALAMTGAWSERAHAAGYYDQAHLISEVRELLGTTPQAFTERRGLTQHLCHDGTVDQVLEPLRRSG